MNQLIDNYIEENSLEKKALRDAFGDGIVQIAAQDEEVVVLNADLPGSLRLENFIEAFPERYLQVGVAEQNMASIAAGLSHYGKKPYITSFAAFSPGLNFSQIRVAAMSAQNLKIVSSHYGLNVGPDGASAQMESDVAMIKALPGMTILNPADYNQAKSLLKEMHNINGPAYMRLTREKFPIFTKVDSSYEIGKIQKLTDGGKLTVVATGSMVYETLQAIVLAGAWEVGQVDFLNLHTIKPVDERVLIESVKKTGKLLIVEEHNVWGGVGETLSRIVSEEVPSLIKTIAINDKFGRSGSHKELWKLYGLDRQHIADEISLLLNK